MAAPIMKSAIFFLSVIVILLMHIPYESHAQPKKGQKSLIIRVGDIKDFKKLVRTRTNLLIICATSEKAAAKVMKLFEEVAEEMKGKATVAFINCGDDKKFCKKLKVSPETFILRHYKDGEFNKEYDRKIAVKSMVNFLLDPTGDLPWEEDPTASDVIHISTEDSFNKLLRKEKNPLLVMFYAPWCGFCKRLKPEFSAAATEIKSEATLVGVDVDKPPMMNLRVQYNITGFPTIYYIVKGKVKFLYGGENNKAGIVSWLKNPHAPKEPEKEVEWADEPSEVAHLTDASFDDFVKENPSVLVMFYAPWCGHCKQMKPGYSEAAKELKDEGVTGILAAIDATKEKRLGQEFGIKGFPTVKYFKDGAFAFDMNEREKDKIMNFMRDPQEPPPPPPPEPKWEEVESEVVHLTDDTFKSFLKKKKHCLIMFYAPWCGHCKKAKPEFMAAADKFKEDTKVAYAAIDCTTQSGTCSAHDVTGYPTFKYFNYGKNPQKYMGGRLENDFITFMNDPMNPSPAPSKPDAESLEDQWKSFTGWDSLGLLTAANFQEAISAHAQVLVMFYAPWCGHCKRMKPAFAEAAQIVKNEGLGLLAAVDATEDTDLATQHNVKGYPTLKFFKAGEVVDYGKGRGVDELVSHMRESITEETIKEEESDAMPPRKRNVDPNENNFIPFVDKLGDGNFSQFIDAKKAAFVMFYDPKCHLCQKAGPQFVTTAKEAASKKRGFAAVDCTQESELCEAQKVVKYPSFKLYVGGNFLTDYGSPITSEGMREFVMNAPKPKNDRDEL